MPCVGFKPTIPASERAKTVHALDRSTTVTGPPSSAEVKNGGAIPPLPHTSSWHSA
jgi:hypothetical protein